MSLFDKTPISELFQRADAMDDISDYDMAQLCFNF
jgi:hypothetical protein